MGVERSVISMVGPNAIGKTTAIRRWAAKYSKLLAVTADLQLEITQQGENKVKGWKGTTEEKAKLVQLKRSEQKVVIIESARTTLLNTLHRTDPVILVVCSATMMRDNMMARCEKRNKKFRADYWNMGKLGYEASDRYINFAMKNLSSTQVKTFRLKSYDDWEAVDAYFTSLYIKLQKQL